MGRSEAFTRGDKTRRQVLGDDWVEASWAKADETTRVFFEASTELLWGSIWPREGLDLKYRSLVTIIALAVLGRREELRAHLRGGLRVGWTSTELREALLHVGGYAGYPLALDAMRVAAEVFSQQEEGAAYSTRTEVAAET